MWKTFLSTSTAISSLEQALENEGRTEIPFGNTYHDIGRAIAELNAVRIRFRNSLEMLIKPLGWNRWTLWGLIAYISGALFGLAAAILAVQ